MTLRPRVLPILWRLFSSLLAVLLFCASCTGKKGEERGESSALLQPAAEGRAGQHSNDVSEAGLSQGGGDAEVGAGGVEGNTDGGKVEDKAEEDDAAFRIIVN